MLTKPKEYEIDKTNPWKDDILKRKPIGEKLTKFIETLDQPFVLSITSEFGTGKSVFIKRWIAHLRKEGFACIEFNAWTNDFSKEPLISFIGEINEYFENNLELFGNESSTAEKFMNKVTKIGKNLALSAIPLAVKLATVNLIKIDDVTDLAKSVIEKSIDDYSKEKNTVTEFKKILEELASKIKNANGENKPIVFVIDELDRCRPTYAIELLEVIKHFFNVPGFVFVLAIDKNQILNSIKTQYGQGMDADGYLRRFIDLEYALPVLERKEFIGLYSKNYLKISGNYFQQELLEIFCDYFDLPLRKVQQLIQKLDLINRISFKNGSNLEMSDYYLLLFMLCLQSYNFDLYQNFVERTMNAENLFDEFLKIKKPQDQFYLKNEIKHVISTIFIRDNYYTDIITFITNLESKREKFNNPSNERPSFNEIQEAKKLQIIIDSLNYLSNVPKLNSQSFIEKANMISHFAEIIGSFTLFNVI